MARALGDAVNALNGQIQLSRIDIASNPSIAQALQVQGAPALFALIGGRPMPIAGPSVRRGTAADHRQVVPKIMAIAQQAGVNGTAPYSGDPDSDGAQGAGAAGSVRLRCHRNIRRRTCWRRQGDYAGAAAAYEQVLEADPNDTLAARERAKALLLARSANADVRDARRCRRRRTMWKRSLPSPIST